MVGPDGPVAFAVVSDGAGTATHAAEGAELACLSFIEMVKRVVASDGVRGLSQTCVHNWLRDYQSLICQHATDRGARPRDFACTLVAAVIGVGWSAFLQVGDGAIVVREDDSDYGWVFWPERGEYANTTFFITDKQAINHLQFEGASRRYTEIALLTDGIQHMVLHYGHRTAHQPFFTSMFAVLEGDSVPSDEVLSEKLSAFLNSEAVNARTDDDKTLILMRRTEPCKR
jgi:hypothetical protein